MNATVTVNPASHHAIWAARRCDTSFIIIELASPLCWYMETYRRGLAVASGNFAVPIERTLDPTASTV